MGHPVQYMYSKYARIRKGQGEPLTPNDQPKEAGSRPPYRDGLMQHITRLRNQKLFVQEEQDDMPEHLRALCGYGWSNTLREEDSDDNTNGDFEPIPSTGIYVTEHIVASLSSVTGYVIFYF